MERSVKRTALCCSGFGLGLGLAGAAADLYGWAGGLRRAEDAKEAVASLYAWCDVAPGGGILAGEFEAWFSGRFAGSLVGSRKEDDQGRENSDKARGRKDEE